MAHFSLLLHVSIILIQCSQSLEAQVNLGPRSCHEDLKEKTAMCGRMGFKSVPQHLPDGIEVLQLEYNSISSLLNSSFTRYPLIAKLDLSTNDLRVIETAAFHPLKNLTRLILCGNLNLLIQGTGIFKYTKKISYFDMSDSLMGSIPYDMLAWSQNVDTLNLESNLLTSINMSLCGRAKTVDLTDNKIIRLTSNTFNFSCNTDTLDLSWNPIRSVDPNVIASLHVKSLRFQTDVITTQTLSSIFLGISNSSTLSIKSLQISRGTKINFSSPGLFDPLRDGSLETLDLSQNNIRSLHPYIFSNLTSVRKFILTYNDIIAVQPEFFFGMQMLRMVNAEFFDNDLWDPGMNTSLFDGLFNLKTLNLSKSQLSNWHDGDNLPPEVLRQLSVLQNLSLEDCDLSDLHPGAFSGLKSLQVLILRNNNLEKLSAVLFKQLLNITIIDLSDNLLMDLDRGIFSSNRELKTLLLSNNKLTHLDQSAFKPIQTSLLSIDISTNPINCNCDISWLMNWLSRSLILQNSNKTICASDSLVPLQNQHLINFDPKEFCSIDIVLICLPSLAIICLILIIGLTYHNRWQLRYKLFLVKLAAIGYKEMRDARDHNDYEFDLNVIFYDDDEDWIREHLRPALAERLPQFQRNVFGDDELVLGMYYLDAVDYVVSHSYKTVVILSRAAVRDRWFILKFRTAMDHVSDTGTEFVVVIFHEDIPDDEMPFLVRLFLSDGRPYIYWTDDVRGHEYFFEELTKHLTINLRTNDRLPVE
ncbi:insulin-like growth factor-binding protein complex acid labile subunit [Lytechinus variegatus]|uniref:insulin-like growth factor-binding protein complex acid labile subunit n=1 Tax=Lytechinus variegatus TaxID=7654 RepID=UPI001BB14355|nr:insulin-like growth factor-binding protein complex acid labile subunit [Lytechinus variegatus]